MMSSEVVGRVAALRTLEVTDLKAACSGVEELRAEVLREIAGGNVAAIALARAALLTIEEDIAVD